MLNIDGNNLNKFGAKLPIPYLEKITVFDESISILLSFYIEGIQNEEDSPLYQDYVASLATLKYSVVAVMDGELQAYSDSGFTVSDPMLFDSSDRYDKYGPVKLGSQGSQLFQQLKLGQINIFDIIRTDYNDYAGSMPDVDLWRSHNLLNFQEVGDPDSPALGYEGVPRPNNSNVLHYSFLALEGDDAEFEKQILYNSDGTPVYKYTTQINIIDLAQGPTGTNTMKEFIAGMAQGMETHFVAFTTSLDAYPDLSSRQKSDIKDKTARAKLMQMTVSDMSYEMVSKDNQIKADQIAIFKLSTGDVYIGSPPIQAIDSIYYGNTPADHREIIATFTDLIHETTDRDLENKFNELAYIISVYGQEIDILPRLNTFRKTFLETSTAVPVGRFHEKLEIVLYNMNNKIKQGNRLHKFLNVNPTVIDNRIVAGTTGYENPTFPGPPYGYQNGRHYIYTEKHKLGSYALPHGPKWDTEELRATAQAYKDAMNIAQATMVSSMQRAMLQHRSLLDTIQISILEPYTKNGIDVDWLDEYGKSYFGVLPALKKWGGGVKYYKHWMYEWRETRQLLDYEKDKWWEELIETLVTAVVYSVPTILGYANLALKVREGEVDWNETIIDFPDGIKGFYESDNTERMIDWYSSNSTAGQIAIDYAGETLTSYVWGGITAAYGSDMYDNLYKSTNGDDIYWTLKPSRSSRDWYGAGVDQIQVALNASGKTCTVKGFSFTFDPAGMIPNQYELYVDAYKLYLQAVGDVMIYMEMLLDFHLAASLNSDVYYENYNNFLGGFVFFDYEKAINTASELSKILPVSKIESLFGRELTQTFYQMRESGISKWYDNSTVDLIVDDLGLDVTAELVAEIGNGRHAASHSTWQGELINKHEPEVSAISAPIETEINTLDIDIIEDDQYGTYMNGFLDQETIGPRPDTKVVTHFLPRNFKFTDPQSSNDYRLIAFELQDSSGPHEVATSEHNQGEYNTNTYSYGDDQLYTAWQPGTYYTPHVEIFDFSRDVYTALVKTYERMMWTDFEEYYESAIEECSYNNSDEVLGYFNKFFVDNVIDHYSDSPHDAPWFRAPVILHTHLDIVNNAYQGSEELIKQAALMDSEKIHPATATLEQLVAFREKIQLFYETYYEADSGLVWEAAELTENNITKVFGGEDTAAGQWPTMRNLPNPVNIDYLGYSSMTGDVVTIDTDELE